MKEKKSLENLQKDKINISCPPKNPQKEKEEKKREKA